MATVKTKSKTSQIINQFESIKDTPRGIVRGAVNDIIQQGGSSFFDQLLGKYEEEPQQKMSGDLSEGQEINLQDRNKKETPKKMDIEPGLDYSREVS